jgi:hypothetical protein
MLLITHSFSFLSLDTLWSDNHYLRMLLITHSFSFLSLFSSINRVRLRWPIRKWYYVSSHNHYFLVLAHANLTINIQLRFYRTTAEVVASATYHTHVSSYNHYFLVLATTYCSFLCSHLTRARLRWPSRKRWLRQLLHVGVCRYVAKSDVDFRAIRFISAFSLRGASAFERMKLLLRSVVLL